ncbi:uncharacterized protein A4U43_C04F20890 [Asparagus officinalis]|uniref:Uncharacterized protein n=1 Tax=Asparagus officinalis TaxID=4686 RepID=A0A5P1F7V9_ASPOF|nr:uncharacterized protein A4U43_C04F20890 [Asparagus officinalis]
MLTENEKNPLKNSFAYILLACLEVARHQKEELELNLAELTKKCDSKVAELQAEMERLSIIRSQAILVDPRVLREQVQKGAHEVGDARMAECVAQIHTFYPLFLHLVNIVAYLRALVIRHNHFGYDGTHDPEHLVMPRFIRFNLTKREDSVKICILKYVGDFRQEELYRTNIIRLRLGFVNKDVPVNKVAIVPNTFGNELVKIDVQYLDGDARFLSWIKSTDTQ